MTAPVAAFEARRGGSRHNLCTLVRNYYISYSWYTNYSTQISRICKGAETLVRTFFSTSKSFTCQARVTESQTESSFPCQDRVTESQPESRMDDTTAGLKKLFEAPWEHLSR